MTEGEKKIYSVGIYARLSVNTTVCGQEEKGESIETQIEIAKAFISRREDMKLCGCYTDVGKTGTCFEREGFEHMMQDVRAGRINCVVVKDLSRFGRNYIETGNYIEKIFPFMGVRFIAVTDQFDTGNALWQGNTLTVELKNLVNEMYARDISIKIKSGRQIKREQGSYMGGTAPYGYRAELIGESRRLLPDRDAAVVVKEIFQWFCSGKSLKEIVCLLYENRIVSPREYRKTGHIYGQGQLMQWTEGTVRRILTNPVYIRSAENPEKVQERCHRAAGIDLREPLYEAIVSKELFQKASERFERKKTAGNGRRSVTEIEPGENRFGQILFCGECSAKMKYTGSGYHCPNSHRIDKRHCPGKYIGSHKLEEMTGRAIWQSITLSFSKPEELFLYCSREAGRKKEEYRAKLSEIRTKLSFLTRQGSGYYCSYRQGEMGEMEFGKKQEERAKHTGLLRKRESVYQKKLEEMDFIVGKQIDFLKSFLNQDRKYKLTKEILETLFQKIEIYPDHRIRLVFAFQRPESVVETISSVKD